MCGPSGLNSGSGSVGSSVFWWDNIESMALGRAEFGNSVTTAVEDSMERGRVRVSGKERRAGRAFQGNKRPVFKE